MGWMEARNKNREAIRNNRTGKKCSGDGLMHISNVFRSRHSKVPRHAGSPERRRGCDREKDIKLSMKSGEGDEGAHAGCDRNGDGASLVGRVGGFEKRERNERESQYK